MVNSLDAFITLGNVQSEPVLGDTFTWNAVDYIGTMGDLRQDVFFSDDGIGKTRNGDRLLEASLSVFAAVTVPQILDLITFDGVIYQLIEIESEDTTNIVWNVRKKMEAAT